MTDNGNVGKNGGSTQAPAPALAIAALRSSEKIEALAAALSKAQGAMHHPQRNKVAKVPLKTGGSYSYNYADLADVIDAVRGPFAANELAMVQIPFNEPGAVGIVTRIMHSSGQWIEGTLYMPCADTKPQSIGSAITYGRRYALAPMAGIASDDDDDGNAAQGQAAETSARPRGGSGVRYGAGGGREEHRYEPIGSEAQVSRPSGVLPEKTARMLAAFTALGVTREALEAHCMGVSLHEMNDADLDALRVLHGDLKAGKVKAGDVGKAPAEEKEVDPVKAKLDGKFKK